MQWERRLHPALALQTAGDAVLRVLTFYLPVDPPSQWLTPSVAFDGALDAGTFLLLCSLALLADERKRHGKRARQDHRWVKAADCAGRFHPCLLMLH